MRESLENEDHGKETFFGTDGKCQNVFYRDGVDIAEKRVEREDAWFKFETGEDLRSKDPNWKQFTELCDGEEWEE